MLRDSYCKILLEHNEGKPREKDRRYDDGKAQAGRPNSRNDRAIELVLYLIRGMIQRHADANERPDHHRRYHQSFRRVGAKKQGADHEQYAEG